MARECFINWRYVQILPFVLPLLQCLRDRIARFLLLLLSSAPSKQSSSFILLPSSNNISRVAEYKSLCGWRKTNLSYHQCQIVLICLIYSFLQSHHCGCFYCHIDCFWFLSICVRANVRSWRWMLLANFKSIMKYYFCYSNTKSKLPIIVILHKSIRFVYLFSCYITWSYYPLSNSW